MNIVKRSQCSVSVLLGVMLISLSACQTAPPRSITEQELADGRQEYLRSYQSDLEKISNKIEARMVHEYKYAQLSINNESQSIDMLVISGGGAFGAFGLGFLKGWGEVNEANYKRPQFDYVSGISTGALIAPFAFIGTETAYDHVISLYKSLGPDSVRAQGLLSYLPGNVALYDVSNLREKIKSTITEELVKRIKIGATENRQLVVGATNMDYGMLRVWDIAQITSEASTGDAAKQIVDILHASTAFPILFPPVIIDNIMYIDGGATMQIVGGINDRSWAYDFEKMTLNIVNLKEPVKIRVWIIVNEKLLPDSKVVQSNWPSVAERSMKTLLNASILKSIQDADTFVNLINQRPEFDAQMKFVTIPQDFPIADSDVMFEPEIIKKLLKLGKKMGADPMSWKEEALRPGAPFELN
ncbi:MAG: patatin-like phospholipase family protein [Gammaproteobacteria bacterium]|nr:patatin-like phospholipase family protein [Gammaproteobacteria bacterium]